MIIRNIVLAAAITFVTSPDFAQGPRAPVDPKAAAAAAERSKADEEACRPPVRKYCSKVVGDGNLIVLACLQENREKIGKACLDVLERNGK
jgi:hypothetical protein